MFQRLRNRVGRRGPVASTAPRDRDAATSSKSFLSTTVLIASLLIIALISTWITALILHRFDYKRQIIINDFLTPGDESPSDSKSGTSGNFGKEAADLFAADLNDILQQGSYGSGWVRSGKLRIAQPFEGIPQIPVSKSYGIEIQGISVDQLIQAWNALRYDQQFVSGDLIATPGSPARHVLQISLRSDHSAQRWTSQPFLASQQELFAAIQKLAEEFVEDTNPEIAGRYYMATDQSSKAIEVFTAWRQNQPDLPEPNLYLAKILVFQEHYQPASSLAEQAENLISHVSRKDRLRINSEVEFVKAMVAWGSGNFEHVEEYLSDSQSKQPYALRNLGRIYFEKQLYTDAEKSLQRALKLNERDFEAEMLLGQIFFAENNNPQAVLAFDSALQINPLSSKAADSYLKALHAANRDVDAAQYCHEWVGSNPKESPVLTDTTGDIYLLCAQAEKATHSANDDILRWYYAEALKQHEEDPDSLFSSLVDSMPQVLCQGNNEHKMITGPTRSDEQEAWRATAARTLITMLHRRLPVDKQAAVLIKDCERSLQTTP